MVQITISASFFNASIDRRCIFSLSLSLFAPVQAHSHMFVSILEDERKGKKNRSHFIMSRRMTTTNNVFERLHTDSLENY